MTVRGSTGAVAGTEPADMTGTLLEVEHLDVQFFTRRGQVRAVRDVSFAIAKGETLGLVGESGSGKSVTAQALLGLVELPGRICGGDVRWKGQSLVHGATATLDRVRGREIAMVFQDPMTSLNPLFPVGAQIAETLRRHLGASRKSARERAVELLDLVGIANPVRRARQYPHEMSGGMRQRVLIAMALACEPELLVADEPTTALDVTIQAQILELIADLQSRLGLAVLLITHDLGVVAGLAHRVMVMYAGRPIETGTTAEVFYETRHPYTLGLLASLPRLDDVGDEPLVPIVGSPPSLIRKPTGCSFHPRCRFARVPGNCETDDPNLRLVAGDAHLAACHYAEELTGITVDSLRQSVDVIADAELADLEVPAEIFVPAGEPEDQAVVGDVAVAEGAAHPGVTDFAEGRTEEWAVLDPGESKGSDDEENP
jgi:peptide/nickel transport system ATP-binding protein